MASRRAVGITDADTLTLLARGVGHLDKDQRRGIVVSNGKTLLTKVLSWATSEDDPTLWIDRLIELAPDSLHRLTVAMAPRWKPHR